MNSIKILTLVILLSMVCCTNEKKVIVEKTVPIEVSIPNNANSLSSIKSQLAAYPGPYKTGMERISDQFERGDVLLTAHGRNCPDPLGKTMQVDGSQYIRNKRFILDVLQKDGCVSQYSFAYEWVTPNRLKTYDPTYVHRCNRDEGLDMDRTRVNYYEYSTVGNDILFKVSFDIACYWGRWKG